MSKSERIRAFEKEACEIFGVEYRDTTSMEIILDARELPKATIKMILRDEHGAVKRNGIGDMLMTETREVILHAPPDGTELETGLNAVS